MGYICTPKRTSVSNIVFYCSITFYLTIFTIIHIAAYSDLVFNCGINNILYIGSIIYLPISISLFLIKKSYLIKKIIKCQYRYIKIIENIPFFAFYSMLIITNLIFYPDSYDGNAYHLPLAIKFLQSNSFSEIPKIWQYTMPSNGESIFMFFARTKIPILLNFSQLILLIGLFFWCIRFNRLFFGLSRYASFITGSILMSMPVVFQGAFFHYIDFFGSTFLYFSITIILILPKLNKKVFIVNSFLAGIFYGISIGTKLTFIVFLPVIVMIFIYAIAKMKDRITFKEIVFTLFSFICGFVLFSSFWYVRNLILYNNPLFPLDIPIFNLKGVPQETIVDNEYGDIFAGKNVFGWLLYPFTEAHSTGQYYFNFGPVFSVIVIPAILVGILYSLHNFKKRISKKVLLFCSIITINILLWFLFLSRQPRFIMIAPFLMVSIFGFTIDNIILRKKIVTYLLFILFSQIMIFYSIKYLKKTANCINYNYYPHNWDAYYQIPIKKIEIKEKRILNLNEETMNFALYGPDFSNNVITTQEVQNTIYGEKLLYTNRQKLSLYTDEQIDSLIRKYGNVLLYSNTKLQNKNLRIYKEAAKRFPQIKWLNTYVYISEKK